MKSLSNAPTGFWNRVSIQVGGCWLWLGNKNNWGYGRIIVGSRTTKNKRPVLAHRAVYEWLVKEIPEALVLDHLCRVRHCVNPKHLEPVTLVENVKRGNVGQLNRKRILSSIHCARGHERASNMILCRNGERYCRLCRLITDRARKERGK